MSASSLLRETLPDETRKVLDLVWGTFLASGTWPMMRVAGSRSGGTSELKRLLLPLDGSYILEDGPEDESKLALRILGILCTEQRSRYLKLLRGYLSYLRRLYHERPEQKNIHHHEVEQFLALSESDTTDLGRLLGFVNFKGLFKASGSSTGAWQFGVPKRIDEIPDGPLDDFLDLVLAEYEEPGSKIWLEERLAHAIATRTAVGYYPQGEEESEDGGDTEASPFDRWYQVFVSSTYKDLREERERVAQALLLTRGIPTGMEFFPASGRPPWETIMRQIDEADYYILIVGGRYGSLVPGESVSYTEREFDYAIQKGKPVIAFCHEDVNSLLPEKRDDDEVRREKLGAFRRRVLEGRTCKHWGTALQLESDVKTAMHYAILNDRQPGWIRAGVVAVDPLASLDSRTKMIAERLLEITWGAEHQRLPHEELVTRLKVLPTEARLARDRVFEMGLLNRMDNLEQPASQWIVFTPKGKDYVLERNLQHHIPTTRSLGLTWNERREPVCAKCIIPLPFFDNRSLRCGNCGTDVAPNDTAGAVSVPEAIQCYGGRLAE